MSLQPQTQFKIDNYVFEGRGSQNESAVMSLLRGGFRTITGLIGKTNRDGYKLQTATATVGIRGTSFSVTSAAGGTTTMSVDGGSITVDKGGSRTIVPSGSTIVLSDTSNAVTFVDEKPNLPPSTPGPINALQDGGPGSYPK